MHVVTNRKDPELSTIKRAPSSPNHKDRVQRKKLRLCTVEYFGPRSSKSKVLKIKRN